MAPKKNKNLPAKQRTTALSVSDQMAQDAAKDSGFEGMGPDDLAIPFIQILQALSPQVRGKEKIKGAAEGDFYNTVTTEVMKDHIIIVPCAYEKSYVEWVLRENGGGFVQKHETSAILSHCTRNDRNQNILPSGNQIVDTAYHYCLLVREDEPPLQVVISLTSTQLKKSRRWNSMALSLKIKVGKGIITPPVYSHTYVATSVEESNDRGQWMGWVIGEPGVIDDPKLYALAKDFHNAVTQGSVRTAPPPQEDRGDLSEPIKDDDDCF